MGVGILPQILPTNHNLQKDELHVDCHCDYFIY